MTAIGREVLRILQVEASTYLESLRTRTTADSSTYLSLVRSRLNLLEF